jgi:hypothetical protein
VKIDRRNIGTIPADDQAVGQSSTFSGSTFTGRVAWLRLRGPEGEAGAIPHGHEDATIPPRIRNPGSVHIGCHIKEMLIINNIFLYTNCGSPIPLDPDTRT